MDPFHVVHLAAEKLTVCRQRIQQITLGHRGRSGDPLYGIKRILLTCETLRTDKQKARLEAVFADEQRIDVEVTERVYQELVAAYPEPNRRTGKLAMLKVLGRIKSVVPKELAELAQLGRSLWKRREEILAYFDTGASNGPVEAINGRLEHLRAVSPSASATSPLHLAVTDPLGSAPGTYQRTLNRDEPVWPARSRGHGHATHHRPGSFRLSSHRRGSSDRAVSRR